MSCFTLRLSGGKSCIAAEIAKINTDKKRRVLFLVHRIELCEQIIKTFVDWGVNMDYCKVAMVQTITKHLDDAHKPDIIICDESHHAVAKTYRRIYEYFSTTPVLGMTATPCRLGGGGLGDVNDKLVLGSTAKWLIANGFLAPYKYYAPPTVDTTKFKIKLGEIVVDGAEMEKPKVFGDVIAHYRKLADGKKAICYCSSLALSIRTAEEFNQAGIVSAHIDGDTPPQERKDIIEQFRTGEVTILCNMGLVSEGFDIPDCEVAILLRPTQSLNLFIQQSMRCMRWVEGKEAIIIDHVGNVFRHGFPDDDREWSLTGSKRKPKEANTVFVKQCSNCYFTYAKAMICPNCGHEVKKMAYEIKHDKEVELERITEVRKNHLAERMEVIGGIENCRSLSECMAWCKVHGYKSGYAWHYWENKRKGVRFK